MDDCFEFDMGGDACVDTDTSVEVPDVEIEAFDDLEVELNTVNEFEDIDNTSLELSELQQNADELEIEPFEEIGEADDDFDLSVYDNIDNAGYRQYFDDEIVDDDSETSGITRGLAGAAAGVTAIAGLGGVPSAEQFSPPINDVPAIHQTIELPDPTQNMSPSTRELFTQLNETIQDAWSPESDS